MERTAGDVTTMSDSDRLTPRAGITTGARQAATAAVLAATLLGIAGDGLLRAPALGINVMLWVAAALVAVAWVARVRDRPLGRGALALFVPIAFFASVFAWRAADGLLALNALALISAFGVLALAASGWPSPLARASLGQMIAGAASVAVSGVFGMPTLIASDRALADGNARPRLRGTVAVVRGAIIALPILLVFGALLSSADPGFERLLTRLIDIDFGETIGHIAFAAFIAWWAGGYLRAAAVADRPLGMGRDWHPPRVTLGIAELATVLGLVDALFALFVAIQLPHLFGGISRVREVAGLTMAEYARGGFFQLVVVATLVLPLLLGSAALVRQDEPRPWRTFRGFALVMIALVAVMIASALQRLGLYVASFGLTEDRVYATAIVIWLSIIFALFIATVLRRREAGFAVAALISGWVVLAALDFANPQAMVVRTNAERSVEGASFDWQYAARLAADATPELVQAIGRLDEAGRCSVAQTLVRVADDRTIGIPEDWRSWNASRVRAFEAANAARPRGIVARCPTRETSP
ncbi:MAG: DUF4153 domain-containing protein [Gemmatimonadaceae bacterium]